MRRIEELARDLVAEVAGDNDWGLIVDDLRDSVDERIDEYADSACTYYHQGLRHIDDLEGRYGNDVEDLGETYVPADWRDAMMSYARQLVSVALRAEAQEALDEIEDRVDEFNEVVEGFDQDPEDAIVSGECLYGWEAHNYETTDGVMVWSDESKGMFPKKLEGELYAVSHRIAEGVWLNLAWTPEEEEDDCAA